MADLVTDVLCIDDERELLDAANVRGRMLDRLADIMLAAEEYASLRRSHMSRNPTSPPSTGSCSSFTTRRTASCTVSPTNERR